MPIKHDIWYPDNFNKSQGLPFYKSSEINETMKLMKKYFYSHKNEYFDSMKTIIYFIERKKN